MVHQFVENIQILWFFNMYLCLQYVVLYHWPVLHGLYAYAQFFLWSPLNQDTSTYVLYVHTYVHTNLMIFWGICCNHLLISGMSVKVSLCAGMWHYVLYVCTAHTDMQVCGMIILWWWLCGVCWWWSQCVWWGECVMCYHIHLYAVQYSDRNAYVHM